MSEQPENPIIEEPEEAGNPLMKSMMEQLREERSSAAPDTADIDVPGYSGKLICRYKVVEGKVLANIGKRVARQVKDDADRQLYGTVDVLIAACEGLYFRSPANDQLYPIDPDLPAQGTPAENGTAATYAHPSLPSYFGFSSEDARGNVFGIFKGNDTAIIAHGITLSRWMADTSKGVDESWLGR